MRPVDSGWEAFKERWLLLLKAQGAASPTTSVEEDLEIVARNAGEEFTKRLNESGLSKAAYIKKLMVEIRESMKEQVSEQVATSRDEAIDEYASSGEWPPPAVFVDVDPDADWVRNAVGFVATNEVELRRVAQLARPETADLARTRFCDGGMLTERAHIMDGLIARWCAQNWLVKEATQRLWDGERDEDTLAMQCDRASRLVVRAMLAVTVSMDVIVTDPEQAGRLKMTFPSNYGQKIYCYEPATGSTFQPGDTAVFKWLTKEGETCNHVELKLYKGIPSGDQRYGRLQFVQIVASKTANTGSFSWTIPADVELCAYAKVTVSDFVHGDRFEDQSHSFSITEAPGSDAGRIPSGAPPAYTDTGAGTPGALDLPARTASGAAEAVVRRVLEKLEAPVEPRSSGSNSNSPLPRPSAAGPNVAAPLEGKRVVITGMQTRPELNGQIGTAVSFSFERGRYTVQLGDVNDVDDVATIVAVRAHNVLPAPVTGVAATVAAGTTTRPRGSGAASAWSMAAAAPDGTVLSTSARIGRPSAELRSWLEDHGSAAGPGSGGAFGFARLYDTLVALGVEVPRDVLDIDSDDIVIARDLRTIKVLEAKRLNRQLGSLQRAVPPLPAPVAPAETPAPTASAAPAATPAPTVSAATACPCANHGSAAPTSPPLVAPTDAGEDDDDDDDIYG